MKRKPKKATGRPAAAEKTPFPALHQLLFLLSVGLILPLLYTRDTVEPVLMPRFLALSLAMMLMLGIYCFRPRPDYGVLRRMIFAAMLLYFTGSALSLSVALNLGEGLVDLLKLPLGMILCFVTVQLLLEDERFLAYLSATVSTLVLILSLIGLAQYFGLAFKEIPGNFILYATMANKNLLASYLLLAMPFVWYGILFFGGKGRILAMLAYLTAVLVIAMVHARTAGVTGGMLLALLAAILLLVRGNYFTIDAGVRKILLRRLAQVLGATAVPLLLAVLIYYGHTARDANLDRAITAASVGVSSVDERLQLWEKTLQMVRDHPLLGVGIGNWKLFIPAYGSEGLRSAGGAVNFVRPHNDFLWVLSESGLPALLGFLAIFFLGGYYAWRLVSRSNQPAVQITALLFAGGIAAYLVVSLASFPRERIAHSALLFMLLAVMIAGYHRAFPLRHAGFPRRLELPLNGLLLLLLTFSSWVGYQRIRAEIDTKKAYRARALEQWRQEITYLTQAESGLYQLDPLATPLALNRGLAWTKLVEQDPAAMENATRAFREAYRVHPYNLIVLNNMAAVHYQEGDLEKAAAFFEQALSLSPHLEHTLVNLTAIYYKMGRYQQAYDTIQKCHPQSTNPKIVEYRRALEEKLGIR